MKAFNFLKLPLIAAVLLLLEGCIGTDVLIDEIRPTVLRIDQEDGTIQLLTGETTQLDYTYENEFGVAEDITPTWIIQDNAIATVDMNGIVTGQMEGQTTITARFEDTESASVLINVSETENDVNKVLIEAPQVMLEVGETVQLTGTAWNVNNMLLPDRAVSWEVDNTAVLQIDANGLTTALTSGEASVTAIIEGIRSAPQIITVGGAGERMASFRGANGYNATGMARLFMDPSGDIQLELSSDFETDFALGTFIYLSNSTGGAATRSSGLEIAEITSGGSATFNVSSIDNTVALDTYQFVIVLCRPARITFGLADFENP